MTKPSVKSRDVTYKTHSGYLATQLPWLVNLTWLECDMNCWLSCRLSPLQSVVTGPISSGGGHGIYCWWDLIRSKQLSSVSVRKCSPDFLVMVIQFCLKTFIVISYYNRIVYKNNTISPCVFRTISSLIIFYRRLFV